jgi:hypothetical protein
MRMHNRARVRAVLYVVGPAAALVGLALAPLAKLVSHQ